MRTVICHFYNEEYLLPWWLKHHLPMFDYGILIDHGSTDGSADICRALAPHWRLVRSRLTHFDACLTDLEVMNYEQDMVGWKIALTVTEFLICNVPLQQLEASLKSMGRIGCAASGMLMVDDNPDLLPSPDQPLPLQKHFAIDDNAMTSQERRLALNMGDVPMHNRFFHSNSVGMYHPGRHRSFMPDAAFRIANLMLLHYHYAPWNERTMRRKLQIAKKLDAQDVARGWGLQHLRNEATLQAEYLQWKDASIDLMLHEHAKTALALSCKY